MPRMSLVAAALVAALLFAVPTTAPAATSAPTASAAAKKKTRAQKLRACNKKARQKSGAARTRALASCRARFGPKKTTPTPPPNPGPLPVPPPPGPVPNPGPTPTPTPPPPSVDPVRNDAAFRAKLINVEVFRQYAVPKPDHAPGYNYHDEGYQFCNDFMVHLYEGIAYIYKSRGPWQVVEGYINGDGTKGNGTIQYTQAEANFPEEVGKVQTIQISWEGTTVQVVHPEIGTNTFTAQKAVTPCP